MEIGWYSLLEALRVRRDPFCAELLAELELDINAFSGNLPSTYSEPLQMLPNKLWALIVLIDALERCPWVALSALPGTLTTYVALSAALVRSAYVYSLLRTGRIDREQLKPVQLQLIECLDQRDPIYFLQKSAEVRIKLEEEELWEKLNELFNDNLIQLLKDKQSNNQLAALGQAALSYFESPVYTSAVKLLQGQLEQPGD